MECCWILPSLAEPGKKKPPLGYAARSTELGDEWRDLWAARIGFSPRQETKGAASIGCQRSVPIAALVAVEGDMVGAGETAVEFGDSRATFA